MTGRGKRVQAEDSSRDHPSASKQQKMPDWCVDCKAAAQDGYGCRGGHRLLDLNAAEKDAQDKLTAARLEMEEQQAHLDALAQARVLKGPVLTAVVASLDKDKGGWAISGGNIGIALAASKSLTDEDREAVCVALEDLEMEYEVDKTESTIAFGHLGKSLIGILDKLPDCVEGQAVRTGTVLLGADGRLEVFFRDMPSRGGPGVKLFGHVTDDDDGLAALEGEGCDLGDSASVRAGYGDECWSQSYDCFCREGGPGTTTLSDVKFMT